MEAREDDAVDLLFLIFLRDQILPDDLQPAMPLPDLFPLRGRVSLWGERIPLSAMIALIVAASATT